MNRIVLLVNKSVLLVTRNVALVNRSVLLVNKNVLLTKCKCFEFICKFQWPILGNITSALRSFSVFHPFFVFAKFLFQQIFFFFLGRLFDLQPRIIFKIFRIMMLGRLRLIQAVGLSIHLITNQ